MVHARITAHFSVMGDHPRDMGCGSQRRGFLKYAVILGQFQENVRLSERNILNATCAMQVDKEKTDMQAKK